MSQPAIDLSQHPVRVSEDLKAVSDNSRTKFKSDWSENLENMSGFLVDSTKTALRSITSGEYAEQWENVNSYGTVTVANRTLPALLRMGARVMGLVNGFQGIPGAPDESDKDAVGAVEKLMQAIWYNEGLYADCLQMVYAAFGCSHGYIWVNVDDTLDKPQKVGHYPKTPFFVHTYPGIRKLSESPVVMVDHFLTKEDILRRWKLEGDDLPGAVEGATIDDDRLSKLEQDIDKTMYKVSFLYYRPDVKAGWPKGRQFVILGDEQIHQVTDEAGDDWIGVGLPDKPKTWQYPLVDLADVPVGYGYWGRGRQSSARAPQKILNVAWSKCSQVASLPGIMIGIPFGSQIGYADIANVPVQEIKYNAAGGKGVEFWTPPRMPHYEFVIQKCEQWIDEIYSQPPPSRGISPGSRFPAKGLQFLQEQAELGDSPFGKMVMDAISQLAKMILIEGQRVWPDEMVDSVVGKNGRWQRIAFKKSDLVDGWDIRVLPDTGLPQSRTARLQAVIELSQMNLLGNMQDPKEQKKARKMARVWTDDDAFEPDMAQEANAKDEEVQIQQGLGAPINYFDDDEVHLRHHVQVGAERAHAPDKHPSEDEVREAHANAHMQRLAMGVAEMEPPQPGETPEGGPGGEAPEGAPAAEGPPETLG